MFLFLWNESKHLPSIYCKDTDTFLKWWNLFIEHWCLDLSIFNFVINVVIEWNKTLFWVKISQNHMSESKCRRGLNLNPMVKVTVKPCRLMLFKTLDKIFSRHLDDVYAKLKCWTMDQLLIPILVGLRTWRYHVRQKLF